MDPLQMATDAELFTELRRRYPTGVFAGESVFSDDKRDRGRAFSWGGPTLCLGLVRKLVLMTDTLALQHIENTLRLEGGDADDS